MDFQELCRENGIETRSAGEHHHATGDWIQVQCPFCAGGNFHLGYPGSGLTMSCWRCGTHSLYEWLDAVGLDVRKFVQTARLWYRPVRESDVKRSKLPRGVVPLRDRHLKWLAGRGLDGKALSLQFELLGTEEVAECPWRIVAPVRDESGQLVGWTGRAVAKAAKRWDSRGDIHKAGCLYGDHLLTRRDRVVVVEGPSDVWRLGPGAVATFGVAFSQEQVKRLVKFTDVFILYDHDKAGWEASEKLANELSLYVNVVNMSMPYNASDPGSLTAQQAHWFMAELF